MDITVGDKKLVTYEDFRAWMLDKKVWYLFKQYAMTAGHDDSFPKNKKSLRGVIAGAFSWSETLEGHDFWEDINRLWNKNVTRIEETTINTTWSIQDYNDYVVIKCDSTTVFSIYSDGTFIRHAYTSEILKYDECNKIKERK